MTDLSTMMEQMNIINHFSKFNDAIVSTITNLKYHLQGFKLNDDLLESVMDLFKSNQKILELFNNISNERELLVTSIISQRNDHNITNVKDAVDKVYKCINLILNNPQKMEPDIMKSKIEDFHFNLKWHGIPVINTEVTKKLIDYTKRYINSFRTFMTAGMSSLERENLKSEIKDETKVVGYGLTGIVIHDNGYIKKILSRYSPLSLIELSISKHILSKLNPGDFLDNHLVRIVDIREVERSIIMEPCDGDLSDLFKRRKLMCQEFYNLVVSITQSLITLKRINIIHRDVTFRNILYKKVNDELLFYLADYGCCAINDGRVVNVKNVDQTIIHEVEVLTFMTDLNVFLRNLLKQYDPERGVIIQKELIFYNRSWDKLILYYIQQTTNNNNQFSVNSFYDELIRCKEILLKNENVEFE